MIARGARAVLVAVVATGCSGEIRFAGDAADAGAACATEGDCAIADLHCDPIAHICVPCAVDADCKDPKATRCDSALHECVECGVPTDCASNETCIPATHECVPTCSLGHETCPSSALNCDTARGICVGCTADAECTSADRPFCQVASGRCVACRTNANCASPSKPRCNVVGGECVR